MQFFGSRVFFLRVFICSLREFKVCSKLNTNKEIFAIKMLNSNLMTMVSFASFVNWLRILIS